jgi:hypothetical protein
MTAGDQVVVRLAVRPGAVALPYLAVVESVVGEWATVRTHLGGHVLEVALHELAPLPPPPERRKPAGPPDTARARRLVEKLLAASRVPEVVDATWSGPGAPAARGNRRRS